MLPNCETDSFDKSEGISSWDRLLTHYAAPTLLGLKPASLFSCSVNDAVTPILDIEQFNRDAACAGLQIIILHRGTTHWLLFLFHRKRLKRELKLPDKASMLISYGYRGKLTLNQKLKQISRRVEKGNSFPHELGLFLGYPVTDVKGFIQNKGKHFIESGCWLVYSNEQKARAVFEQYRKCRCFLKRKLLTGERLFDIIANLQRTSNKLRQHRT